MSFLFSVIDAETKKLTLAIAGHPPLYHFHRKEQKITEIGEGYYPLGINAVPDFDQKVVQLMPGDVILYYTDGIPERRNEAGQVFGYERLTEALSLYASEEAKIILQNILRDLNTFSGDMSADDDMTLVVLKVVDGA